MFWLKTLVSVGKNTAGDVQTSSPKCSVLLAVYNVSSYGQGSRVQQTCHITRTLNLLLELTNSQQQFESQEWIFFLGTPHISLRLCCVKSEMFFLNRPEDISSHFCGK